MPEAVQPYAVGQRDTRPWGEWMVIDIGAGFVVKRITVRPGQRLSLQRHRHRDEHWVVVQGAATVTRDAESFLLGVGQVTRIGKGRAVHRGRRTEAWTSCSPMDSCHVRPSWTVLKPRKARSKEKVYGLCLV